MKKGLLLKAVVVLATTTLFKEFSKPKYITVKSYKRGEAKQKSNIPLDDPDIDSFVYCKERDLWYSKRDLNNLRFN